MGRGTGPTWIAVGNLRLIRGPLDRIAAEVASPTTITLAWAAGWLVLGWLACRALYRRRLFLKV